LAYLWLIYSVGFLIKFATQNIVQKTIKPDTKKENKVEQAGKLIGQFERIIILSLVLLDQYEAIGFFDHRKKHNSLCRPQ